MIWLMILVGTYVACVVPIYVFSAAVPTDSPFGNVGGCDRVEVRNWQRWIGSVRRMAVRVPVPGGAWRAVRSQYQLRPINGDPRRLQGRIDGCDLLLIGSRRGLEIRLDLRDPLPPLTRVTHRRPSADEGGSAR